MGILTCIGILAIGVLMALYVRECRKQYLVAKAKRIADEDKILERARWMK